MWYSIFRLNKSISGHSDFTDVESLYEFKFFQKNFGARRARAKLRALEKRAHSSSVAKSGRNKKTFLQKCEEWQNKIFGLTEIFVNTSSDQNLILCKKKGSTLMSTWMNIAIFHVYAVVRTSIIFWDMKMTNIWKDIYFW